MATTCSLKMCIDYDVKSLSIKAIRSMQAAGLSESVNELKRRVVGSNRFTEVRPGATRLSLTIGLTPFSELLLREVMAIAIDATLDDATKTARISHAMNLAGY